MSLIKWLNDWVKRNFPQAKPKKGVKNRGNLPKDQLGRDGEALAVRFLKQNGYKIIEKNVSFEDGELDVVAKIENFLVFLEVKTRRPGSGIHPALSVTKKKQKKIKILARRYYHCYQNAQKRKKPLFVRFDIISVLWPEGGTPKIEHFIDAFQ